MTTIFLKLFNMGITAGWIVLAVLLLRPVFRKIKLPGYLNLILWALVGIRLILPFSFESVLSLIPSVQTVSKDILTENSFDITTGFERVDTSFNQYLDSHYYEGVTVPTDTGVNILQILTVLWLCGVAAMLLYTTVSYLRLYRKVKVSVRWQDKVYLCDHIDTPFILGIFRPKIYLPSNMDETDAAYVIAHEKAHLSRYDHWIKPFSFLLLSVYWFHPLLWVGYLFLCRDIELACDEKVIGRMDAADKKAYSNALLACSIQNTLPRRMISACPLAFGEVGVKKRITAVLNYKKPAFWLTVSAVVLCAVLSVCFLTDPPGMGIDDIDPLGKGIFKNVSRVTVIDQDYHYVSDNEDTNHHILRRLKKVRLELSDQSREEDRSKDITVKLLPGDTVIYMNADCTEVWLSDSVKPSYTYRILNPEVLTENGMFYEYEPKGFADTATTVPGFDMTDRDWVGMTVQTGEKGDVVACHSLNAESYPDADELRLTLSAKEEVLTLTDHLNGRIYTFACKQPSKAADSWVYEIQSEQTNQSGYVTVAFTAYADGSNAYTLVLRIGGYTLYAFEQTQENAILGAQLSRSEIYQMDQPVLFEQPTLRLNLTEETFIFNYSLLSSYLAAGSFTVKNDTLICTTADGSNLYQFDILGYANEHAFTGLRFDAENSSKIPSYRYSTDARESICPVEDGAKFLYCEDAVLTEAHQEILDELSCDIDGDGMKEVCTLTRGVSTLSATIPVTLTVAKQLDSYTYAVIFEQTISVGSDDVTLESDKDGNCAVYVWDNPPKDTDKQAIMIYEIKYQDGKISFLGLSPTPLAD